MFEQLSFFLCLVLGSFPSVCLFSSLEMYQFLFYLTFILLLSFSSLLFISHERQKEDKSGEKGGSRNWEA